MEESVKWIQTADNKTVKEAEAGHRKLRNEGLHKYRVCLFHLIIAFALIISPSQINFLAWFDATAPY
jgi:hypothetical protein